MSFLQIKEWERFADIYGSSYDSQIWSTGLSFERTRVSQVPLSYLNSNK